MAFGDVNLGRAVGQELLKGKLDYPFKMVKDSLAHADVVFANLESQLTEQKGETQHPKYNLVFCGPPVGAAALRMGNISVVSTANNHAYDYGMKALVETVRNLQDSGILRVGTSIDSLESACPVIVERNEIRIGFLAYTQFMNFNGSWVGHVALFNKQRASRDIEELRSKVDVIVVSYHGGAEYVDKPGDEVRRDFRFLAECGADIVVGHHPHYVQGIEWYGGKLLFYSLGNFVFFQPQRDLTQFGLGVEFSFLRRSSSVEMEAVRLIPLHAGLQPSFVLSAGEERSFFERLKKLSPAQIDERSGAWFIQVKQHND